MNTALKHVQGTNQTVWLITGEASGDMHAAGLVHQLKQQSATLQFKGVGGPALEAEGMVLLHHINELAVMGFSEVVLKLPHILKLFRGLVRRMRAERPQAVILVDFPDFNLRLARKAWQLGIPVIYYISPQLWAWRRNRIKSIKKYVTAMMVIFPFEADFYRQNGVEAYFTGYPLAEKIEHIVSQQPPDVERITPPTGAVVIGILPGSRHSEVKKILPVMIEGMKLVQQKFPETLFLLPLASTVDPDIVTPIVNDFQGNLTITTGNTYSVMSQADFIFVASGTATLEAACLTVPMVVVYRVSTLSYLIARSLIRVDHIAMTNLVAGRRLVPELVQADFSAANLFEQARLLIEGPERRQRIRTDLAEIRNKLHTKDAYKNAAAYFLEVLRRRETEHGPVVV